MKNILILVMVIFGITSCSKDSFDLSLSSDNFPVKSEIMVRVSYLEWTSDQCESGCGGTSSQEVSLLANAKIHLYEGSDIGSDDLIAPVMDTRTGNDGAVLLENLEPGIYTVWVETPLGEKSRTLTTQLNKRSFIDFSF